MRVCACLCLYVHVRLAVVVFIISFIVVLIVNWLGMSPGMSSISGSASLRRRLRRDGLGAPWGNSFAENLSSAVIRYTRFRLMM